MMKKTNDELLFLLFNNFYSNRFFLVGYVVHKATDKGIDCSKFSRSLCKMTVFGYFLAVYPTLINAMEKIDECDLYARLKMFNFIKKTTPTPIKKWRKKDKANIDYSSKIHKTSLIYRAIMANSKKSNLVCIGTKLRTK